MIDRKSSKGVQQDPYAYIVGFKTPISKLLALAYTFYFTDWHEVVLFWFLLSSLIMLFNTHFVQTSFFPALLHLPFTATAQDAADGTKF